MAGRGAVDVRPVVQAPSGAAASVSEPGPQRGEPMLHRLRMTHPSTVGHLPPDLHPACVAIRRPTRVRRVRKPNRRRTATTNTVEIFHRDKRVASHRRRFDRQPSTVPGHVPSAHRAHAEWLPSRLIGWAEKVRPATGQLVTQILQSRPHPEQGYCPCLGIMQTGATSRKHPVRGGLHPRAGARLLPLQTVKNIRSAGQDRLPLEPPAETNPTPTHANIRDADYYAATHEEEDRC